MAADGSLAAPARDRVVQQALSSDPFPRLPVAFKHPRSGYYYTERQLPGYGTLRRISLGTKRKPDAAAIETAILEVHRRGMHDPRLFVILDELQGRGHGAQGRVSPADVLVAIKAPDGQELGLQRLLQRLDDPPLADVVAARLAGHDVTRAERVAWPGLLEAVAELFGQRAPVSVLLDAARVQELLRKIEAGGTKLSSSVVRYDKRAVSKLLAARYGRHERDRVLKNVAYTGSDDRRRLRESVVTPAAIARLCDELTSGYWQEGDEAAPLYVRLACSTGATVRPLSEVTEARWNGEAGLIYLTGTKRARQGKVARDRELQVPPQLIPDVEKYSKPDLGADRLLFPLAYSRFGSMWKKAVKRAKLDEAAVNGRGELTAMTPHDLRRVYAMFARRSGLSREKVGLAGLGHDRLETTERYIRSLTSVSDLEAAAVATALGF